MAVFNPSPGQTSDPNYLGWSKSITQPEGDKSAAYVGEMFKDASQGIGLAVTGLDDAMKKGIDDQIHNKVDDIRDRYTEGLQTADSAIRGNLPANVFEPQNKEGTPTDLQALPQKLATIQNLRDNLNLGGNNHVSETMYRMELATAAKDFRSKYLGYRDYVDATFKKVTGTDPANALVESLRTDINSFLTTKDKEKDTLRNHLMSNPYLGDKNSPGTAEVIKALDEGRITIYAAQQWYDQRKGQENSWKLREAEIHAMEEERKLDKNGSMVKDLATNIANTMFANNFADMEVVSGTRMTDALKSVGTDKLSDQQAQIAGQKVANEELATRAAVRKRLYQTDSNGVSIASRLPEAQVKQIIDDAASIHKEAQERFLDKDKGGGVFHAHAAAAIGADAYYRALGNPDMRAMFLRLEMLQKAGGQNVFSAAIANTFLESEIPKGVRDALKFENFKGFIQSEEFKDPVSGRTQMRDFPKDKPYTVNQFLDTTDKLTASNPSTREQAYKEAAQDPVKIILNPQVKPELKLNTARYLFGPGSENSASRFISAQGGLFKVYSQWTSPEMTAQIKQLDAIEPGTFNQYRAWAEKSFVSLYKQHMASVDQVGTDSKDFKFQYNINSNQIEAVRSRTPTSEKDRYFGRDQRDPRAVQQRIEEKLTTPLNMGLATLANIAKQSGEKDIPVYILKTLKQNGVDTNKLQFMVDSMRLNYTQDDSGEHKPKGPSVSEFFQNPAGSKNGAIMPTRNYGDSITGTPIDIPDGVSPQQHIRRLKSEGKL